MKEFDVLVESYHADNGRFAEKEFREEIIKRNQSISFCAVGAHHQNGVIENRIKDCTYGTRTMLLHAKRFWPEAITIMLWPFALLAYIERRNNLQLDSNNQTPLQKICKLGKKLDITKFHTWGCPVFVLESQIQTDPKGLPKWNPRARVGIYLGHSPVHARNVALVLNPATGHVSPQFHLVFDDDFTTVESMRNGTVPQNWCELVSKSSE